MDPNAALAELRQIARAINATEEHDSDTLSDAARMAEVFDGLDRWIRQGGFLPKGWERK